MDLTYWISERTIKDVVLAVPLKDHEIKDAVSPYRIAKMYCTVLYLVLCGVFKKKVCTVPFCTACPSLMIHNQIERKTWDKRRPADRASALNMLGRHLSHDL